MSRILFAFALVLACATAPKLFDKSIALVLEARQ